MPRQLKERPYNNGTFTEAQFFSMIRSALRQSSRWWKPIAQCKINARRKYTGTNKRKKWEYLCANCGGWFDDKNIQVDHIVPAGSLSSFEDLSPFIKKLFCEVDGLQVLCLTCHSAKCKEERKNK